MIHPPDPHSNGNAIPAPSPLDSRPSIPQAYEIKFVIDEPTAARIESWSRRTLAPDPHADPTLPGGKESASYRTTSLYLDTPTLDVYHRTPSYRRRKFRIRRYGTLDWVVLERKTKSGDIVSKRRIQVPDSDLPNLDIPLSLDSWTGHWFHQRTTLRNLHPAGLIAYTRTAFIGECPESPLRLTLDRDLRGVPHALWRLPSQAPTPESTRPLLPGRVVLEFKFLRAMPRPFKDLMYDLRLSATPVSKYRLFREAWQTDRADQIIGGTSGGSAADGREVSIA